ncbi:MAG: tetratricopeptide repeat protein, partial [Nitrospinota bacterium]
GGGVCISGKVYDEVKNKLALGYEFLGEQQVKNIAEPVRAYRVRMEPEAAGAVTGERRAGTRRWQWTVLAAVVVLLAGAAAVAVWLRPWAPSVEVASEERMAFPLPEKPSIAVLPFANLSGDPEQEYFADGMTDDLITDLSKVSGLFVIARNSVFAYKGKPVKVRQVAEELGVRYVLEGSVRRAEGKIRINAQLIDATTGRHLWADRYDRDYKDIFALQDEVTGRIVSALRVKLTPGEKEQLARRYTDNLEAYDYYLRGEQSPHSFSTASGERFIPVLMYEKAIELDPKFARAFAGHAMANYYVWRWGYVTQIGRWIEARTKAFESVTKALALDAALPRAHSVLAQLRLLDGRYDEAIASAAKAVAIDPNNADSYVAQAFVLTKAGRHDEAAEAINKAYRLNPKAPPYYDFVLGIIQFGNRQYAQAIESLKKSRRGLRRADFFLWYSAPSYAHLGRLDEAKAEVAGVLALAPFENLMRLRRLGLYRLEEDIERYVAGFRKAGVPQLPYGYKGSEENKLTGEQIGVLLFGRTTTAIEIKSSQQFLVDRTREGRITVRGPLGSDSGTSRIEGDMVCDQLQAYGKSCGFVFLNPKGSPKKKNEYHLVSDLGIFQFSPVD